MSGAKIYVCTSNWRAKQPLQNNKSKYLTFPFRFFFYYCYFCVYCMIKLEREEKKKEIVVHKLKKKGKMYTSSSCYSLSSEKESMLQVNFNFVWKVLRKRVERERERDVHFLRTNMKHNIWRISMIFNALKLDTKLLI